MKRYLLVEQGEYSDYGVSLVEVPERCSLTDEEIVCLLKIDEYDDPRVSGEIMGQITLFDNASIDLKDIKTEAMSNINGLFSCYPNRKHKTVLDRKYSKEECLLIARENDNSAAEYWKREIDSKYQEYVRGFALYQKLLEQKK